LKQQRAQTEARLQQQFSEELKQQRARTEAIFEQQLLELRKQVEEWETKAAIQTSENTRLIKENAQLSENLKRASERLDGANTTAEHEKTSKGEEKSYTLLLKEILASFATSADAPAPSPFGKRE
jgi:regulator of replication initiation timing